MAVNEIDIPAPPADVWDVLLDPYAYVQWVVGGRSIRGVDPGWPEPGTRFHHTAGMWPFVVADSTRMVELRRPDRLVLEARARPVGVARVVLSLAPADDRGTHVVFVEEPISGPLCLVPRVLLDRVTKLRNAAALRRLRTLVGQRLAARR